MMSVATLGRILCLSVLWMRTIEQRRHRSSSGSGTSSSNTRIEDCSHMNPILKPTGACESISIVADD